MKAMAMGCHSCVLVMAHHKTQESETWKSTPCSMAIVRLAAVLQEQEEMARIERIAGLFFIDNEKGMGVWTMPLYIIGPR